MQKARIHKLNTKLSKESGPKPLERQTDQEMFNRQCGTVWTLLFGGARKIQKSRRSLMRWPTQTSCAVAWSISNITNCHRLHFSSIVNSPANTKSEIISRIHTAPLFLENFAHSIMPWLFGSSGK